MKVSRTAVGVLAGLLLLSGCQSGGHRSQRGGNGDGGVAAVEAAVPSLERARAAVTSELDAVLKAAAQIDARDAAGARGDRDTMHTLVRANPFDDTHISAVAAATTSGAASYVASVDVLSAAAAKAQLPSSQKAALTSVVDAARADAAAAQSLSALVAHNWPQFNALGALELKWLMRARSGWYRNQSESANAYAVLTARVRPRIENARPALAHAADRRQQAADRYRAAVAAFRAAGSSPTP